jgi:ribose transport system ATP-binding protein
MAETILKMESINKTFPGVKALDGVTVEIKRGKVHAIVGENGAGKTTLIKVLIGALYPDKGKIILKRKRVFFESPADAQREKINVVHQESTLVPYLSIAENIFIGQNTRFSHFGFMNMRELYHQAEEILNSVDAHLDTNLLVSELTPSERKQVEIAKALSINPGILILDEPTAPLSDKETHVLFGIIRRLKKEGKSIIYISHRLEEIFQIADSVTVLKDGKLVDTLPLAGVDKDRVVSMTVGREISTAFPQRPAVSTREKVLSVRELTRGKVLKGVSFDLFKGEILGIAGLKGQGQERLSRAIFGIYPKGKKDKGESYLFGKKLDINFPLQAMRSGIAFLSERRNEEGLCLTLSVRHNIALPSMNKRQHLGVIKWEEETKAVKKIVSNLTIRTPSLTQAVEYLSGGNRQKVVIGKWLLTEPRIFVVDEPTVGIDVGTKVELYHLFRRLANQGMAILMVSSDLMEIIGLCDRILVMYDGQIVKEFKGRETTEEEVAKAMWGKKE